MSTSNPITGANHISRDSYPPAPPIPVDPNKVDLGNRDAFESARELLRQASAAEMKLSLEPDGRIRIEYQRRHSPLKGAIQRNRTYIAAVLASVRPSCETSGDCRVVEEFI